MKPRSLLDTVLRLVRPEPRTANLRLLVVSTPRVGNTWMRTLLTRLYGFDEHPNGELAVHDPADVPWNELPPRCILQLHWHKVAPFTDKLDEHGFRRLTLARHPLDVLISILQLAQHTNETARWLGGEGGDESTLRGATPRSQAFLSYATGPRAAALLSVSEEWWTAPHTLKLRYEDVVRDTARGVRRLTRTLGYVEPPRIEQAIASCAIDRLVTADNAPHFWQGKPGLWRALLTADLAERIAAAHRDVFHRFGYSFDADPSLTGPKADANWLFLRNNPRSSQRLKSA